MFEDTARLINAKPMARIPYLWKLETEADDNVMVRLCAFETSSPRQPRAGDKELYVYFMSLSSAGSAIMLGNGMGSKPIDSIKVIFDEILKVVRKYKVELLVFNFPKGRMKGQEGVLKKVVEMLAKNKSRGLLEVIESEEDVYLKSKNKEAKSADEIKEFLQDKTYTSVIQQTRLTDKELLLVQNGFGNPGVNFKQFLKNYI